MPKDPRPVEERHDGPTFAEVEEKQGEFEDDLRDKERKGADDEAFEDAVKRERKDDKPDDPESTGSTP